jgi:hypothetical protein
VSTIDTTHYSWRDDYTTFNIGNRVVQSILNSGLPAAFVTTVCGSLLFRIVAAGNPTRFMAIPLLTAVVRLCLLLSNSGIMHFGWIIARVVKSLLVLKPDEVYYHVIIKDEVFLHDSIPTESPSIPITVNMEPPYSVDAVVGMASPMQIIRHISGGSYRLNTEEEEVKMDVERAEQHKAAAAAAAAVVEEDGEGEIIGHTSSSLHIHSDSTDVHTEDDVEMTFQEIELTSD